MGRSWIRLNCEALIHYNQEMSFLTEIKSFKRQNLQHSDTIVHTIDGRKLKESHDKYGHTTSTLLPGSSLGFVGDYTPDLQVAEVLPGLYFGSQDVAADFDILTSYGVTHILNVASHCAVSFPEDFTYLKLDILDIPSTDICSYFPQCFQFIDAGRESGKVFVHCNAGVSRAASIVIGYLMKTEKLEFLLAFEKVKAVRPCIRPNDGFREQLKKYQA